MEKYSEKSSNLKETDRLFICLILRHLIPCYIVHQIATKLGYIVLMLLPYSQGNRKLA